MAAERAVADPCPAVATHTPCPDDYLAWHEWAEAMSATHDTTQCPTCGLWAIWTPRATGDTMDRVLTDIRAERARQDAKWGEQNHPDGTGRSGDPLVAEVVKADCDRAARDGTLTYRHILNEEVCEAFAETDPAKLRAELVQVAAVTVAWIEKLDRAGGGAS